MFGKKIGDTSDEEDLVLAEKLAEMWRYRLKVVYPERKFMVETLSPEETRDVVGVIFYTDRT